MATARRSAPSLDQQDLLLDYLQEKHFLVNGCARTAHARERTKSAWQQIANKLNSDVNGCDKTWQQWAKYWKDKKSAVKKKYYDMQLAKQQRGSVGAEDDAGGLTAIEEKIIALVGADDSDTKLFQYKEMEPGPSASHEEVQEQNSNSDGDTDKDIVREPTPNSCAGSLRRRLIGRRRLGNRISPSKRQIAGLTERLIAIEERRVSNEEILIRNQQHMINTLNNMSQAWLQQSHALIQNQQEMINALNNMSEAWLRQSQAFQALANKINDSN